MPIWEMTNIILNVVYYQYVLIRTQSLNVKIGKLSLFPMLR